MQHHRNYDVSCLPNYSQRKALENAIDAINMACLPNRNAWAYVQCGDIRNDCNYAFDTADTMKHTIFSHILQTCHGNTIFWVIDHLVLIASDYDGWRRRHEETTSEEEGEIRCINQWRHDILMPYYASVSGGACRSSVGPILREFLLLKSSLRYQGLSSICSVEEELKNILGSNHKEQLEQLNDIITNICTSPELLSFRDSIERKIGKKHEMDELHSRRIAEQVRILRYAIESRNPVALKDALNPEWSSLSLYELKEYREAYELLEELGFSSCDHVDEKRL